MLVAAGASLALALRAPLTVTVLGLVLFGVLHNVLEIRYVAGRFASLLTGRFLALLLALTSGIAVCRLTATSWPTGSRYAEVAVGYAILAAGCWIGLRGIALAGRPRRPRLGRVRLVQLPGLPLRGAHPPAQPGPAGLPLGLGPPHRRRPGPGWGSG